MSQTTNATTTTAIADHSTPDSRELAASYKDDFHDFEGLAYFNAAYMGPMPRVASAALEQGARKRTNPYLVRDRDFFDLPDEYRREVAALIGAEPQDVVVADSAIHTISCLTNGLDWRAGDEALIPAEEFPSNRFPWLALAERGVVVREVSFESAADAPAAFEAATSARTRVVSVGWVHYASGRRIDLDAVGDVARRHGALFAIDGSQGIGGLPFSVAETRCDLVACTGYKWLLGPYGLAFGWIAPELQERLAVPRVNWFAVDGARDFARLATCDYRLEPGARCFDTNETADFINLPAGIAALRYVRGIGPAAIGAHVAELQDRIVESLPAVFRVSSDTESAFRSNLLCLAGADPGAAGRELVDRAFAELERRQVRVSRREGRLRISPHLYNDADDVARLVEGLHAAVEPNRASVVAASPGPRLARLPVGGAVEPGDARRPARAPLEGDAVRLIPLDPTRDAEGLFHAGNGDPVREQLWTYLAYGPFESVAAMRGWLEGCARSEDPLFYTVTARATGEPVGMASFLNIEPSMRRIEIGHLWYAPEWQRGRANRDAVERMIAEAVELGYRRIEWKCDALNERSRRAAVRLGFRYEGLFRRHMISKGRNRDTAWYSMTSSEWLARGAARA